MQFDPETLKMLLNQSDEALWKSIKMIGSKNGIKMKEGTPSKVEMERLRALLAGAQKIDPKDAKRMVDNYKNNQRSRKGE